MRTVFAPAVSLCRWHATLTFSYLLPPSLTLSLSLSPPLTLFLALPLSLSPRGILYGVGAGPQESPHRRCLLELLAQAAKGLSLQRHAVVGPNGHQVPLFTALDAQGLLGADGRFYLLDLFRSLPADANYCPEGGRQREEVEKKEGSWEEGWPEQYQSTSGLPRKFPHGLCRLRSELLQAFIQDKSVLYTSS